MTGQGEHTGNPEQRTTLFAEVAVEHRLQEARESPSKEMPHSWLHMVLASWPWVTQLQLGAALDSVRDPFNL